MASCDVVSNLKTIRPYNKEDVDAAVKTLLALKADVVTLESGTTPADAAAAAAAASGAKDEAAVTPKSESFSRWYLAGAYTRSDFSST
jgi:hypothetical protein